MDFASGEENPGFQEQGGWFGSRKEMTFYEIMTSLVGCQESTSQGTNG